MTCKDCIHCEACERMISDTSKMFKVLLSEILKMNCDIKYDSTNILSGAEICQCFQDRSRFVELPCKLGDEIFCTTIGKIYQGIVGRIELDDEGFAIITTDGYCVDSTICYHTQEEAEQALKERENNDKTDD